jgi:hypothetical protein
MFRRLPRDRPLLGLALAALVFAIAGLARVAFGDPDQAFEPMALLPATLLGGVIGGMRIGVAIFVVCLLTAWIWFFPPNGTLILSHHDAVTVALFALTAILELSVVRILNLAINDLSVARERSNTLFRELQHRVANNLQFAVAVLHASKRTLEKDGAGSKALDAACDRLGLMSRVHRRLHDPSMTEIPLGSYLEELCRDLINGSGAANIELKVEVSDIRFGHGLAHHPLADRGRTDHELPQARLQ